MVPTTAVRYSLSFKHQVIHELESGRFRSINEARQHYGISGGKTISCWLRQYGKNHLCPKVVRVEKLNEQSELRQMKQRIKQLEEALGKTQVENILNQEFLKIACRQLGQEVDQFKKKSRYDAVHEAGRQGLAPVKGLCEAVSMSRQNYYKSRHFRQQRAVDEDLVLSLVRRERQLQPCLGGRKLLCRIGPEMTEQGVTLGRDRFFGLLRRHEMLILHEARYCRTTDSRHGFGIYGNVLKDAELTGPRQAVVSDITYIRTVEGFMYVSLVMDAYSRAILLRPQKMDYGATGK